MKSTVTRLLLPLFLIAAVTACTTEGDLRDMSSGEQTAVFQPVIAEYGVDLFVDDVDGEPTKFGIFDQVVIDAGTHEIGVRLEYQPAAGTSLILGSVGNLLLRAGTNKTFRTTMTVDVASGHTYRLIACSPGETLEIILFDETDNEMVLQHMFELVDGELERVF